jgi:hypothetical protein
MTRSIFDPTGDPERSGSRFTPPDADQISQMPEEFVNPPTSLSAGVVDFTAPADVPAIAVSTEDHDRLLVVRLSGKLHKSDYQHFIPIVEQSVKEYGQVRMLVEMHNFHGWDAGALWEDVKFDAKHFNHIERLALVGESKWEQLMSAFCAPFTTAKIRYFAMEQLAEARAWIVAGH